jgi:DNA-binding Xre family transcriptional regulator
VTIAAVGTGVVALTLALRNNIRFSTMEAICSELNCSVGELLVTAER